MEVQETSKTGLKKDRMLTSAAQFIKVYRLHEMDDFKI